MRDPGPLRAAALAHAARGWSVFPLRPDNRPHDPEHPKKPAFPDHGEDRCPRTDPRCRAGHTRWQPRATCDPGRIERAWSIPYNVGIACGPARLVVIDLDTRKLDAEPPAGHEHYRHGIEVFADLCHQHGQPVPGDTYTVGTAGGGRHLVFEHPAEGPQLRNTQGDRGGLGWLIDTRAHGGYIVAAGSTACGRPYRVLLDRPPIMLPAWLAALLRPAEPAGPRKVVGNLSAYRRDAYVRGAVYRTIDRLAEARQPGRNNTLFVAAATLGQLVAGGALTETEVYEALTPTALGIGLSDREIERAIRSGLAAGARRPRQVA